MDAFLDRPLTAFLDDLAAASPTPGGGSAAAVATAMAAGLLTMAARASSDGWADARGVAAQAQALRDRAGPLAQLNAEAHGAVLELLADSEQGADRRDSTLGAALSRAAALPLEIAETACDVAELGALVAQGADPAVRPDAVAAVLLAESAARIGAQLVRANLGAQAGDERLVRAEQLAEATAETARRVLRQR